VSSLPTSGKGLSRPGIGPQQRGLEAQPLRGTRTDFRYVFASIDAAQRADYDRPISSEVLEK
jgi:hypothetical protein